MHQNVPLSSAQKSFLELRFGQFIHFGLYSLGEEHEWHMRRHKMSLKRYKNTFLKHFNPDPAGMEQWVINAKEMGAKYITCTAKHLDGFPLWDTSVPHPKDNRYHIRSTPFWKKHGTDIITLLHAACKKHGLKMGLYYCILDCSCNKKVTPFSSPAFVSKKPAARDAYTAYYHAHLEELVKKFDNLLLFWIDGYQFNKDYPEALDANGIYKKVKNLDPRILMCYNSGNTREVRDLGGTDVLIFENMAHHGEKNGAPWPRDDPRPAEVCLTINNHWGYNSKDKNHKNSSDIMQLVLENERRNSNTLLNFGPKPDGYIADDQVKIAREIGDLYKLQRKK